jgi:transketolase
VRNTFIKTLTELAKDDPRIFLICGDLGYSVLEVFADQFPDRYLNVGIAEQNMMGVATGLSMEGYNVFTYSIGNFPTLRCMEQIRYDICYHSANVKIVAVGGGYAYGPLGVSHHTTEELGMLRTIPNLKVAAPGDPAEVAGVTKYFTSHSGPGYIRLNKTGEQVIHKEPVIFGEPSAIPVINNGSKKAAICATGDMVGYAYRYIKDNSLDADLFSFPFVSPIDFERVKTIASSYLHIITLEEHQLNCGFGSAILEAINNLISSGGLSSFPKVSRLGIDNKFVGSAGTQDFLREQAGLNLDLIFK